MVSQLVISRVMLSYIELVSYNYGQDNVIRGIFKCNLSPFASKQLNCTLRTAEGNVMIA
jgi:hypothetical protein